MAELDPSAAASWNIFSQKNSSPPDDTVFFSIFPDFAVHSPSSATTTSQLQSLHLQILETLSPYTSNYIWQHEPFNLCVSLTAPPHLTGKVRFGDNLEDEWFVVFLLFEISRNFQNLAIRVWDNDGEFLLIETAFHLPRWLNPDTATNRIFIRRGHLHIIPKSVFRDTPDLQGALRFLIDSDDEQKTKAPEPVQLQLESRLKEYPLRAEKNVHRVRVRVPVSVAQVLKHDPCLIALAVEGFYDRDIDTMKFAAKMERFLRNGTGEELVPVVVRMSRAMYAQLAQQAFQAPKCYPPLPPRSDMGAYLEAELGMKIACGFEMMYQLRKKQGMEGKGSTWEAFKKNLEKSGYFGEGLLPGSQEYKRLMQNAEEYYRNSSLHARTSETLSAPVRRIDEILAFPHSADDFKNQDLPPSDDDSWLYGGEDELNAALQERQKETEDYNLKHKKKQNSKEQQADSDNLDDCDLKAISKSMQAFVEKMSSYQGAEVPESSLRDVDFDADRFMEDINSLARRKDSEDTGSEFDIEEGSNSDMEFDESDDESDGKDDEAGRDPFMESYTDVLNEELKGTMLSKSFARPDEQPLKKDEGTSGVGAEGMDEEFTPVDVDFNLVKNLIDSYSSQQGLPGPASNLLGLLGLQLPQDSNTNTKGK